MNGFTNKYSYDYLVNYSNITNQSSVLTDPSLDVVKSNEFLASAYSAYVNSNGLNTVKAFDFEIDDVLIDCKFNGITCNGSDFVWFESIFYY